MKTKQLVPGLKNTAGKIDLSVPAEYFARLLASFLLARGRVFGDFSPFGVSFAAAAPPTLGGTAALAGMTLGYLTMGVMPSLRYIAAAVITRAVIRVVSGTEIGDKRFFAPLVAAASMACTGFVYLLGNDALPYDIAVFAVETALCGGLTFFYGEAMSLWDTYPWKRADGAGRTAGILFMLVSVDISLAGLTVWGGISIGRIFAVLAVMLASFRGGIARGAASGVVLGIAMDMASAGEPFFAVIYGMAALVAGIFPRNGRFVFDVTFIMANALGVVWMWGSPLCLPALYEMFIASVVFLLLPDTVLAKVSAAFPAEADGYGFLKAREYTRRRTELAAKAFAELYETVRAAAGDTAENDSENVASVFDAAAETVCRSCSRSSRCWQQDYSDTADMLNRLSPKIAENGSVEREDFDPRFAETCRNFDKFADALNAEAKTFRCRRQYRRRLAENRGAAYRQYADVAAVLKKVSAELGGEIRVEPALEKRIVKYLRGMDIEASAAVFRLPGGRLRIEIRSPGLYILRRDKNWLSRLSALVDTPLCTSAEGTSAEYAVLTEAEPLTAEVAAATVRKRGEEVSGDRGIYFRTEEGIMYVLLSDGMGSGGGAAEVACSAVKVLENFLRAGMEAELALGVLGDLLFLKNDETVVSATVDLMRVDLFTGETRIYKYGASPSYLKRGSAVKRVSSGSFPAGFIPGRDGQPFARVRMMAGAFAVMVSDGVTAGEDDKWLRSLVSGYAGEDAKELSRLILEEAARRSGSRDDMTALVMKLGERK